MKVITIGNTKGGTRKSTVAVDLAICAQREGLKTVVINADDLRSSFHGSLVRSQNKIKLALPIFNITNNDVYPEIKKNSKADLIIINSGAKDSNLFRSSIIASDIIIVPVEPSPLDARATGKTIKIIDQFKKIAKCNVPVYLLMNGVGANSVMSKETKRFLGTLDAKLFKTELHFRQAYKKCFTEGKSVIEYTNRGAAKEIKALWREVCNLIQGGRNENEGSLGMDGINNGVLREDVDTANAHKKEVVKKRIRKSRAQQTNVIKTYLLYLPVNLHAMLKHDALFMNMTMQDYIVSILRRHEANKERFGEKTETIKKTAKKIVNLRIP